MQRLRILVILILLSLMPLYSLAVLNEGQYAFRSLDINNGLSQNTVHAILQDKQGFMWFGTKDGLDRYDGIFYGTHALPISICVPVIRSNSRLYLVIRFSSNTFSSIPTLSGL